MSEALFVSLDVSGIPEATGGVGRYMVGVLKALSERPECYFTAFTRVGDDRWQYYHRMLSIRDYAPQATWRRLVWEQTQLPLEIRHARPDVHHSPHYSMPLLSRVPRVVTIHDMTFITHPEWHERSKVHYFRRAIAVASAKADVLICVSQRTADLLQDHHRVRGEIVVAPHGVDHDAFAPEDKDGTDPHALRALGIERPFILFLGTVEPRKNVPSVIRAFNHLASAYRDVTLVIAGAPGWDEQSVTSEIQRSPFKSRIARLGWVPEESIPALLRQAAVVAYPSLEEGFGLPVLEALACGAPVVTTENTAMSDVSDGAATLVPPRDDRRLAEALEQTLGRGTVTGAARRLDVASRYTWRASAERHIEAYRLAAARR